MKCEIGIVEPQPPVGAPLGRITPYLVIHAESEAEFSLLNIFAVQLGLTNEDFSSRWILNTKAA